MLPVMACPVQTLQRIDRDRETRKRLKKSHVWPRSLRRGCDESIVQHVAQAFALFCGRLETAPIATCRCISSEQSLMSLLSVLIYASAQHRSCLSSPMLSTETTEVCEC
jgi:hypothetical protein